MLRNGEFRSIIVKLFILVLIFAVIGSVLINILINTINKDLVERDMALIASIMKSHPELGNELIPYITKNVSKSDKALGQAILRQYGYNLGMDKRDQPLLKRTAPYAQILTLLLILFSLIPLFLLVREEYRKIYRKVNMVSSAAEGVVEGDFSIFLNEEGEGDFYILNHQVNQMANRLENTLDKLSQDKVFLKDLISNISHQLKTPLSSLIMLNDLLLEEEEMDQDTRRRFLQESNIQLDRIEWLIINLLKLARLEAGAIEFKKDKVAFKEVIDLALEILGPKLQGQNIVVKGDKDSFFYGDKNWTSEALINIVKNAREYSKGKIEIELEETLLFNSIKVRDNGNGIDKKDLPYIFDRFYKASDQTNPDSIGIGLNLAKLIVESQNGSISVKSEKGKGTEFIMTFLK